MKKEILYRGFHEKKGGSKKAFINGDWVNGEWVEGLLMKVFDKNDNLKYNIQTFSKNRDGLSAMIYEVIEETISQFTGALDVNKNKIFENDIAKDSDIHLIGIVKWDNTRIKYVLDEIKKGPQYYDDWWKTLEVIGNVFENPYLGDADGND